MRAIFIDEQYNEDVLLEGFNLGDFISRFSSLPTFKKLNILASLFLLNAGITINQENKEKVLNNPVTIELASQKHVSRNDIEGFLNSFRIFSEQDTLMKDPLSMYASDSIKDFIKDFENLCLEAYDIGDGKITIGYGHAEPIETSKYKLGYEISEAEAERLFRKDIKWCEDGIKRMFKHWKEQGVETNISQNMFDSMVSMAYNMGVSGLNNSMFAKALKHGKYIEAANMIPYTRVKNVEVFSGLYDRRQKEKSLFLQGFLNENVNNVLKGKSEEEILNSLEDEEDIKKFIINKGTELFFSNFKWLQDEQQIKILLKILKNNKVSLGDIINDFIEIINVRNNNDWDETMKDILNDINDYDLNYLLHQYKNK